MDKFLYMELIYVFKNKKYSCIFKIAHTYYLVFNTEEKLKPFAILGTLSDDSSFFFSRNDLS